MTPVSAVYEACSHGRVVKLACVSSCGAAACVLLPARPSLPRPLRSPLTLLSLPLSSAGHEHPLNQLVSQQRTKHVAEAVERLVEENESGALDGITSALSKLSPDQRKAILAKLSQ